MIKTHCCAPRRSRTTLPASLRKAHSPIVRKQLYKAPTSAFRTLNRPPPTHTGISRGSTWSRSYHAQTRDTAPWSRRILSQKRTSRTSARRSRRRNTLRCPHVRVVAPPPGGAGARRKSHRDVNFTLPAHRATRRSRGAPPAHRAGSRSGAPNAPCAATTPPCTRARAPCCTPAPPAPPRARTVRARSPASAAGA